MLKRSPADDTMSFATWFCGERIETFRKDMEICMTPDENKNHAYMPAIMSCASFIELFSGLYAGKVKPVGITNILNFTSKFLDKTEFDEERICLFFSMFRHKVAHMSRPYSIFDSHDGVGDNYPLRNYPQRRFTWKVTASFINPAIQIIRKPGSLKKSRRPPWKQASYDHICQINLKRMIRALPEAVTGKNRYLISLSADPKIGENFRKCMDSFYP